MKDFAKINKALWNKKTALHLQSDFYDQAGFMAGKSSLKDIELALLGDVQGKKILHLQCHFGQDTLSLARMGATVTGVDLSDAAIKVAEKTARQLDLSDRAKFICCDIHDLDQHLEEQFDIVFTSYGTIAWFPTLDRWGELLYQYLRPDGQFIFVEFHPMVWMLDDDFTKITYPYFNTKTFHEAYSTSYTDGEGHEPTMGVSWNHPLSEVFQTLLKSRLKITHFLEYDYSPYDCFPNTIPVKKGFQLKNFARKLPMVYSIIAEKDR